MKMHFKPFCLGFAALLLTAPVMRAEEAGAEMAVGGGLTIANDSIKKATHKTYGFNLNISTEMAIPSSQVKFRPGLGLSVFPGSFKAETNPDTGEVVTSKAQLTNLQATFDVLIPLSVDSLNLVTGLSVNQWRTQGSALEGKDHPYNLGDNKAKDSVRVGFRAGLDYRFHKQWSAEVLFQMVEFGSYNSADEAHYHNINPTWLQIGVKYHF